MSEISIGKRKLRLVRGDITERVVDAIVNAANSNLYHGGGVAAAIVAKGEGIIQEESDKIGYVPTGNAIMTCRKIALQGDNSCSGTKKW